ncbi:MAG: hypothetical protein KBD05_02650 [Candidatus Pacebacteria bacterium]|nr:hypothetical protein [Candidatus Paceibacterota bacterium]
MRWDRKEYRQLIEAVLNLETTDEAQRFLRDLLTEGEIHEFATRLKTAELLSKRVPYSQIEQETGFSSATIARVSKWLRGGEGGYRAMLRKLAT